ncbi:MAG: glycosyltransferase [Bacteroidota bacterium]
MNKKIKVLHVFNSYIPNSQNWIINLMNSIPDVEIYIYAKAYEKNNFYNSNWVYFDTTEAIIIKYLKSVLEKANIFLRSFVMLVLKFLYEQQRQKLRQFISREKIVIVHSHFGNFSCSISKMISGFNIKHIVSFYGHDYESVPFHKPQYLKLYKKLFLNADKFICEGSHGANILIKMGCPPDKISIVHLGIDSSKFENINNNLKPEKTLKLIQIANITEKKGHIYTVKAFIQALNKCPNMHLTIVGDVKHKREENLLIEIKNVIKNSGYMDKIHIVKSIDYNQLHGYLENFDVFIHPSTYAKDKDCEGGAPVVLLDAQVCGLPIISTTHCDIPEEVIHKKTGYLSKEKDIKSISESIIGFYNMNNSEFQVFRENAFRHVRNNYDINDSGKKLYRNYSELV